MRSRSVAEAAGAPHFIEETGQSGLDHVYDGEFPFFVGGGIAVFDCNEDRFPDAFVAGGVNPAGLYLNRSEPGGELRFQRLRATATDMNDVVGAYPIDIDGDDTTDLVVLRHGENVVLRGIGDCQFRRANDTWAIDGGSAWTTSFSATWESGTTLPTLAFGNYLVLDENGNQTGACADNELLRPSGDGYGEHLALSPSHCTLSMLFSDWNRSGDADLRVSNDRQYYRTGGEQLWRIEPGVAPALYTENDGWRPLQLFGMGIASIDITDDGYPEVFLTSMGDNKLQTLVSNEGGPVYEDIALERGVTAHRPFTGDEIMPSTAWHAEFEDVNNDGLIDLFIAKGNVEAMPEAAEADPNNLLLGQVDGTFVEAAADAGLMNTARTRGAAVVDLNLDGMLDVVDINRREPVRLWRNLGSGVGAASAPMGRWLQLEVNQPGPNTSAIGGWIEVRTNDRTWRREITIGGGHAGDQLGWIHFGLAETRSAEVRVVWPDGEVTDWRPIAADSFAIITRGDDGIELWEPAID